MTTEPGVFANMAIWQWAPTVYRARPPGCLLARKILLEMGRNGSGSYSLLPRPSREPAARTTESTVPGMAANILRHPS